MKNNFFTFCVLLVLIPFLISEEVYCSTKKLKELDAQIRSKSTELKKIEDTIKQKKRARDEEKKKEEIFRKEIRRIESALSALLSRQQEIKKRIRKAQQNLRIAKISLDMAKDMVSSLDADFRKTINNLWLSHSSFKLISFKNNDIEMKEIIAYKKKLYSLACENEQRCMNAVEKWQLAKNELAELEAKLAENLQQQKEVREEKKKLLTDTTARRIAIEEEIKSLNATSEALHNMISELEKSKRMTRAEIEKEAQAKKKATQLKGKIPWPVRGQIVTRFGKNKRDDIDVPVISNGIRIKTSPRAPVLAVAEGECMFADNFRNYGQMVVLDHGGGFYTIYGLLDELAVKVGNQVSSRQKVGVAGDNADGNFVYFEVRMDGQPVDPLLWLEDR